MDKFAQRLELKLPVSFIREGGRVVAYTPALDISTAGKNEAEATERFNELVTIFFDDLLENGTVDAVLSELGWSKSSTAWNPPAISQSSVSVHIPALV